MQCLGRKPANRDLYKEFGGVHNLFCFHYEISSGVFEASGFLLENTKEVLFLSKSVQGTENILTVHLQMLNLSSVARECSHGAGVKADVPERCRSCTGRCLLQKGNAGMKRGVQEIFWDSLDTFSHFCPLCPDPQTTLAVLGLCPWRYKDLFHAGQQPGPAGTNVNNHRRSASSSLLVNVT